MKKKHIFSSAACVALSIFAASCASDEITTSISEAKNSDLTAFVGGIGNDSQVTRGQINGYDTSVNTINNLTRAVMERTQRADPALFSWEKGDYIYVRDDYWNWNKSTNTIYSATTDKYKFHVEGEYLNNSYPVIYKGNDDTTNDGANNFVTIKAEQTQSEFNNTEHFKESGDWATGTATKIIGGYEFVLEHRVSYLCFLPYSTSQDVRDNYKIKKVALISSVDIAGTYQIPNWYLWSNSSKTVTLNAGTEGFALTDCTAADINKSLYMIVAPGTGYFRVDVTLNNGAKDSLISKTFSTVTLKPNTINNIPLNLIFESSSEKLYDYSNVKNISPHWEADEFNSLSIPNANVMAWYISKGNAMWDDQTLWTGQDGKTYTGGVWIKKLQVIMDENGKTEDEMKATAPDGENYDGTIDVTDATFFGLWTTCCETEIKSGKPAANELKNYFFLPSLYSDNKTENLGQYWTSSIATCEWGPYWGIMLSGDRNKLYITAGRGSDLGYRRPNSPNLFK